MIVCSRGCGWPAPRRFEYSGLNQAAAARQREQPDNGDNAISTRSVLPRNPGNISRGEPIAGMARYERQQPFDRVQDCAVVGGRLTRIILPPEPEREQGFQ